MHDLNPVHAGMSAQLSPAPIGKRILAYGIDLGIACVPIYVLLYGSILLGIFFLGLFASIFQRHEALAAILTIAWMVLVVLVGLFALDGYFIYFEYKKGATLGKRMLGLRVVSLKGPTLTLKQCIIRDLSRLVDCLLILPGLISILSNRRHQRLGDFMAGTLVVYSAHQEISQNHLYLSREQFLEMQTLYEIGPIEELIARDFKKYCFQRFIKKTTVTSTFSEEAWGNLLKRTVFPRSPNPGSEISSVHTQEQLLRFLAEHLARKT